MTDPADMNWIGILPELPGCRTEIRASAGEVRLVLRVVAERQETAVNMTLTMTADQAMGLAWRLRAAAEAAQRQKGEADRTAGEAVMAKVARQMSPAKASACSLVFGAIAVAAVLMKPLDAPAWAQNMGAFVAWAVAVMAFLAGMILAFGETPPTPKPMWVRVTLYVTELAFVLLAAGNGWYPIASLTFVGWFLGFAGHNRDREAEAARKAEKS